MQFKKLENKYAIWPTIGCCLQGTQSTSHFPLHWLAVPLRTELDNLRKIVNVNFCSSAMISIVLGKAC